MLLIKIIHYFININLIDDSWYYKREPCTQDTNGIIILVIIKYHGRNTIRLEYIRMIFCKIAHKHDDQYFLKGIWNRKFDNFGSIEKELAEICVTKSFSNKVWNERIYLKQ